MTDFTFDEGLGIGSFLTGLVVSLATWIFFGLIGTDSGYRVTMTILAFGVSTFGVIFLALPTSTRKTIEKRKQTTPMLKSLDLESSGLAAFSFEDIPNIAEIQRINLGINELRTIDLTLLAGNTNLVELILYMNHLETIDLSPLASCPNLEYLDLTDNDLENIDLTPLSSCFKLTGLNIGMNETSYIDLSPLLECRDLEVLNIDDMKLKEVDLSPLKDCRKLWFLKLDDNELTSLDITPLFECAKLTEFPIDNVELTTTLSREIDDWPLGVRKTRKKIVKM